MHYPFNHTTGGTVASGTLLRVLAMYKLISKTQSLVEQEEITKVFYDVLHPVNKRAIANLLYKTTGVTTHARLRGASRYERFEMDSFVAIRGAPFPAGTHKAVVAMTALKRVLKSGIAPFLPWADRLPEFIAMCSDAVSNPERLT
ncbi:hypothetical protein Drorol1_Dr00026105 [Drosera rotundifolia]